MSKRLFYSLEFKQEAVRLLQDRAKSAIQIAKDLGISESALRRWQHEMGSSKRNEQGPSEHQQLLHLRQKNRILRQERDILKNCPRASSPL
jgi:transposase